MRLEDIHAQWAIDQEFDTSMPDVMLRQVPKLHHKWWGIYSTERERFLVSKNKHDELYVAKYNWYTGRMSEEERVERQWPRQPLRMVKEEAKRYTESDVEVATLRLKMDQIELRLKYLEDILKHINQRSFMVKTYVDFLRFSQGAG